MEYNLYSLEVSRVGRESNAACANKLGSTLHVAVKNQNSSISFFFFISNNYSSAQEQSYHLNTVDSCG